MKSEGLCTLASKRLLNSSGVKVCSILLQSSLKQTSLFLVTSRNSKFLRPSANESISNFLDKIISLSSRFYTRWATFWSVIFLVIGQWEAFITDQKDSEEGWLWRTSETSPSCNLSSNSCKTAVSSINKKKILKTYHKRSIITLYALWIMRGSNSVTLWFCLCQNSIKEMTIIFEKGWGRLGNFFLS